MLPAQIGVEAFDTLHDDAAQWRDILSAIAREHGLPPIAPMSDGTALVGLAGSEWVVKLYPPFLRNHCDFEAAALGHLHGRLSIPTPRLVQRGERDGWPYLVMTQLAGEPLTRHWARLDEAAKCGVLRAIGRVAAQVHALPVDGLVEVAPEWNAFMQRQRASCTHRQERTGLPVHLLAQVEGFIAGEVARGPDVILTGEYTPMNLMYASAAQLALPGWQAARSLEELAQLAWP